MSKTRLIARLDIKGPHLIKGIHLEGLRVIGSPNEHAIRYYLQGADELIYMDSVASLYGRNNLLEIVSDTAKNIFIPVTVGGGIRSVEDAANVLRAGADKVAVNTAAVSNPSLISDVARQFGSQCMVLSVEAKQVGTDAWEVYTDNGRERTGLDVLNWVKRATNMGAGEILLTSIDREGTRKGMGGVEDLLPVVREGGADGVAMADILHYKRADLIDVRKFALAEGLRVRAYDQP